MQSLTDIRASATSWLAARRAAAADWIEDSDRGTAIAAGIGTALAATIGIGISIYLGYLLYELLTSIGSRGSHAAHSSGDWLTHAPIIRLFTDPITSYISTRAPGSGLDARQLVTMWGGAGVILALLALLDSRGARIAWPLYGAANVAMAYYGAADTVAHRPLAAGAAGLAWCLLSVIVLHRASSPAPAVIVRDVVREAPVSEPASA